MTPRSCKSKGRRGAARVRDLLLRFFPALTPSDVFVKATSQAGTDLHLSETARRLFPFDIESKQVERLDIWSALNQATAQSTGLTPIVFFGRNRTPLYVAMEAEHFLRVLTRSNDE